MIPEIGLFCLLLALGLSVVTALFLPFAAQRYESGAIIITCMRLCACFTLAAMVALIIARVQSDFSVVVVAAHSNRSLPLLYKIVGSWGAHEGSMVLWAVVMACFGAVLTLRVCINPPLVLTALCVHAALLAGALAFIVFTSNPFLRQFPLPYDGATLTPLLQDIALSMHPPMLYLGYVGFSLVFSLGIAGLLVHKIDAAWADFARPWILVPWCALTIGIGLGSWWAYRVLGWGGFWFWDPVENASLLPWLAGTALLHANKTLERRGMLGQWVALLAVLTFAMSLIGTFLVRSGLITSVHSFASDPARGVYIIVYFIVTVGGALTVFALRGGVQNALRPNPFSREGMMLVNSVLFTAACATVLLGTLYPMAMEWLGQPISVGPPYFNITVLPVLALAILLGGVATRIAWGKADAKHVLYALKMPAIAAITALFITLAITSHFSAVAALGMGLAVWMITSVFPLRRAHLGVALAHGGAGIVVLGIVGAGLWQVEVQSTLKPGDALTIGPYVATYDNTTVTSHENYLTQAVQLRLQDKRGMVVGALSPERRTYAVSNEQVNTPAILPRLWGDIYAVANVAAGEKGNAMTITLRLEPLIYALWAGCIIMAAGGVFAIINRRRISL